MISSWFSGNADDVRSTCEHTAPRETAPARLRMLMDRPCWPPIQARGFRKGRSENSSTYVVGISGIFRDKPRKRNIMDCLLEGVTANSISLLSRKNSLLFSMPTIHQNLLSTVESAACRAAHLHAGAQKFWISLQNSLLAGKGPFGERFARDCKHRHTLYNQQFIRTTILVLVVIPASSEVSAAKRNGDSSPLTAIQESLRVLLRGRIRRFHYLMEVRGPGCRRLQEWVLPVRDQSDSSDELSVIADGAANRCD